VNGGVNFLIGGKNMAEADKSKNDFRLEASIPACGLLWMRSSAPRNCIVAQAGPPDYGKENCALVALVSALSAYSSPQVEHQALFSFCKNL
jgi:hypothetical protein